MGQNFETDVVIIGAGPVGLFAVFELGMLKIKAHVVDTLDESGGQCTALYPEKPIYDIPGFPVVSAGDLIEKLEEQAAPFHPHYHLGQQVVKLDKTKTGWRVETSRGAEISCKAIVIAAGAGAFGPNRPPLDGIEAFEERRTVQYYVKRRKDFTGKRVVIAGGGDSAVDWAVSLAEVAASVAVVHRRDKFRAAPEMVDRMRALASDGRIEMMVPYQLAGLQGEEGKLEAVVVKDLDGTEKALEADVLLPFYGLSMTLGPIAEWGLDLEHNHILIDQATAQSSEKGIFAIGDIATYPQKLKLILAGFSEGASAAHAIHPLIFPDEALHFEYSTTAGVPGE